MPKVTQLEVVELDSNLEAGTMARGKETPNTDFNLHTDVGRRGAIKA